MMREEPRFDGRTLALLIAGAACVLPFIQPRHLPPLRAFYDEWLAFALFCCAFGLVALGRHRDSACLHTPVLWLAAFAILLFGRSFIGESAYAQSPFVWGIYVLFASLVFILGQELASSLGRERVCDTLAACLLAGALLNAICAVLQIFGIPRSLSDFISHTDGLRATGNVGQANLYANYLALGQASVAYLFARGRLNTIPAIISGLILVVAASLAGSRASLLYAAAFALLGYLVVRSSASEESRRLVRYVMAMSAFVVVAQWAVPAGFEVAGHRMEGGIFRNAESNVNGLLSDEAANLRLAAWAVAIKLFAGNPWLGVGPDEFPGAAFSMGLPAALAGEKLWTSPHNVVLHLLSETGLLGAIPVVAAALAWLLGACKEFFRKRDAAIWFLVACVGVEAIHSLLEYPLWYAHFLGLSALLMGVSMPKDTHVGIQIRPQVLRATFGLGSVLGILLLSIGLAAYLRFDAASPVAAGRSLASDSEIAAERNTLAQVSRGLLASRSETWLFLAYPLDGNELEQKISAGQRVTRVWPSREVACRHSIFLALAGRRDQAVMTLTHAVLTFPEFSRKCREEINSAPLGAREILLPILR